MGAGRFRLPMRDAKIIFEEGTTFAGAEVKCRLDVSIGFLIDIGELAEGNQPQLVYKKFGDEVLISWNLEDEGGKAISADGQGMRLVHTAFADALLKQWKEAATSISDPLEQQSKNGSTSEEPSGVMA